MIFTDALSVQLGSFTINVEMDQDNFPTVSIVQTTKTCSFPWKHLLSSLDLWFPVPRKISYASGCSSSVTSQLAFVQHSRRETTATALTNPFADSFPQDRKNKHMIPQLNACLFPLGLLSLLEVPGYLRGSQADNWINTVAEAVNSTVCAISREPDF